MKPRPMQQETLWITKAKGGDHNSFRALYDLHVAPLYRFLRQFASESAEVEEWVQRTFVKAYERLGSFDGRSRFSTWLFALGINEMRMDRRRAQRAPIGPMTDEEIPASTNGTDEFEWDETMQAWMEEL